MRYKAPENCTGISVGGEYFDVDESGHITVPDDGDYHNLVIPHGFIPATDETKPAGKKRTAVAEPEPTASTAVAE